MEEIPIRILILIGIGNGQIMLKLIPLADTEG